MKDLATQTPLLRGTLHNGLYRFHLHKFDRFSSSSAICLTLSSDSLSSSSSPNQVLKSQFIPEVASSTLSQWHYRLGHSSFPTVKQILTHCNTHFSRNDNSTLCSARKLGKNHRLPFPISYTKYTEHLQLIYSDVWGPAHNISTNGYRYYVSFVDAYSRYTWIFFLKQKSEVFQVFHTFTTNVELQCNKKIKALQTDWGEGEGSSFDLWCLCFKDGVLIIVFPVHVPRNKMG